MRPNKQYVLDAVLKCRLSFGPKSVRVVMSDRETQRALQFPSGVPSDWSATQKTWDMAAQVANIGMPLSLTPVLVWHDTDMSLDEWAQVIAAVEASLPPAPAVPSSPSYGAAGNPSMGRLVQYQLGERPVVALIECVYSQETGDVCLLHFGLPPEADQWQATGSAHVPVAQRARTTYGTGLGQWQYLPRV